MINPPNWQQSFFFFFFKDATILIYVGYITLCNKFEKHYYTIVNFENGGEEVPVVEIVTQFKEMWIKN